MKNFLNKHNYLLTISSTVLIILIVSFTIFLELNEDRIISKETADFIDEYKTFENKFDANHNTLLPVNIDNAIKIKYVDPSDAVDLIYNDIGILFVGTPDNQESRVAIENLVNTCLDNHIDTIYYIDITRYQTDYAVNENGLKDYVYDDNYNTLLNVLDEYLGIDTYKFMVDGVEHDTGAKRIGLPNVFAFKGGYVVGNYKGVGKNVDAFQMSNKDLEKLKANYKELIMLTRHHNV